MRSGCALTRRLSGSSGLSGRSVLPRVRGLAGLSPLPGYSRLSAPTRWLLLVFFFIPDLFVLGVIVVFCVFVLSARFPFAFLRFQSDLGNDQRDVVFVLAEIFQIVRHLGLFALFFFLLERLLHLGFGPASAAPLHRHLRRRRRRRIRLEECLHLLRRLQFAVNQLQKHLVHNLAVVRQLWSYAHLLHQRVRDPLPHLRPNLQEVVIALLDRLVLRRKAKPQNRFRIVRRE